MAVPDVRAREIPGSVSMSTYREVYDALRNLLDACAYVSPIAGAVATKPSVKDLRAAGRFMDAIAEAEAVIDRNTGLP